jgi:hypothetical protein
LPRPKKGEGAKNKKGSKKARERKRIGGSYPYLPVSSKSRKGRYFLKSRKAFQKRVDISKKMREGKAGKDEETRDIIFYFLFIFSCFSFPCITCRMRATMM